MLLTRRPSQPLSFITLAEELVIKGYMGAISFAQMKLAIAASEVFVLLPS
jgi:hypothetical protein